MHGASFTDDANACCRPDQNAPNTAVAISPAPSRPQAQAGTPSEPLSSGMSGTRVAVSCAPSGPNEKSRVTGRGIRRLAVGVSHATLTALRVLGRPRRSSHTSSGEASTLVDAGVCTPSSVTGNQSLQPSLAASNKQHGATLRELCCSRNKAGSRLCSRVPQCVHAQWRDAEMSVEGWEP